MCLKIYGILLFSFCLIGTQTPIYSFGPQSSSVNITQSNKMTLASCRDELQRMIELNETIDRLLTSEESKYSTCREKLIKAEEASKEDKILWIIPTRDIAWFAIGFFAGALITR